MKYKARSKKLRGWLTLEFQDTGLLAHFENRLKGGLTPHQIMALRKVLPRHIEELPALEGIGFELEPLAQTSAEREDGNSGHDPAHNPVAIWCAGYNAHHAASYKVSKAEAGMLTALGKLVAAEVVETYIKCELWWASPKSVANFCKHINQVRELVAKAAQGVKETSQPQKELRFKLTSRLEAIGMEARKLKNTIESLEDLARENPHGQYHAQAEGKKRELEALQLEAGHIKQQLKAL